MPSGAVSTSDGWEFVGEQPSFFGPWVGRLEAFSTYSPKGLSGMEPQLPTAVSGHHMESMWVDVNGVHICGYSMYVAMFMCKFMYSVCFGGVCD